MCGMLSYDKVINCREIGSLRKVVKFPLFFLVGHYLIADCRGKQCLVLWLSVEKAARNVRSTCWRNELISNSFYIIKNVRDFGSGTVTRSDPSTGLMVAGATEITVLNIS